MFGTNGGDLMHDTAIPRKRWRCLVFAFARVFWRYAVLEPDLSPQCLTSDRSKTLTGHGHLKTAVGVQAMLITDSWPQHHEPGSLVKKRPFLQRRTEEKAYKTLPDEQFS